MLCTWEDYEYGPITHAISFIDTRARKALSELGCAIYSAPPNEAVERESQFCYVSDVLHTLKVQKAVTQLD